jgi:hypothetical protein
MVVEPYFDFIINKKGDALLILEARSNPPSAMPHIIYNKKDKAMLVRNPNNQILLTEMPKEVLKKIAKSKFISVGEVNEKGDFIHQYKAKIVIDKKAEFNK